MNKDKHEAAVISHAAKLACDVTESLDTIDAHLKAFQAHDRAARVTMTVGYKELAKFHTDRANLHVERIAELQRTV